MTAANTDSDNPEHPKYIQHGLLIAVIAAFLFSTKPILIKHLYQLGIEPLPLMWLRMLLALPIYLIVGFYAWKRLPDKPSFNTIISAALVGLAGYYLASYLDLLGLQYISAQFERVILYAYPSFVVLFGALFFKYSISQRIILPLVMTYTGLIVMYSQDLSISGVSGDNHVLGTLLILASAISFSFYILFSKKMIGLLGSLLFTSVAMTSSAFATTLHIAVTEEMKLVNYSSEVWFGLFALTMLATVLPSFLTSEAIKRIGPAKASMTGTLGPVATSIMAVLLLGETISITGIAGMLMVITGIYQLSRK
jgi:drug/metabolite transporter (DMT)-like permease